MCVFYPHLFPNIVFEQSEYFAGSGFFYCNAPRHYPHGHETNPILKVEKVAEKVAKKVAVAVGCKIWVEHSN